MRTITLEAGQHVLTDGGALHLLGRIESFAEDCMTGKLFVEGQTYEFPMVPGLETAETDTMYGRLIETPAGLVRAERLMAIIPFDTDPCLTTHSQGAFWGLLDLTVDTELAWGPGWYQLAGQERVDLMLPQLTEMSCTHTPGIASEPLTCDEIVAMGFSDRGFHNSSMRSYSAIEEVMADARKLGVDSLVAKLQRMYDAGAREVYETLVLPPVTDDRPNQRFPVPYTAGMCSGQASIFGVAMHPDSAAVFQAA